MSSLFVVATPIGNLADITFRAIETLNKVDFIFCEDTRVTKKLLKHYNIDTPCISYHSFSGFSKIKKAIDMLESGKNIALVSDAGTPSISDPGVKFVREIKNRFTDEVKIESIPGASALIAALAVSGSPASQFVFWGFLPRKKGRKTIFEKIVNEEKTSVFYESPHRIIKTLQELDIILQSNREVFVAREITKIYESYYSGTIKEILSHFKKTPKEIKGEFVVIVSSLYKDV